MTHWKLTGIVATFIIALSIPLYVVQDRARRSADSQAITPAAAFVGSDACRDCHPNEYDKWQGSHHQWPWPWHRMKRFWEISPMPSFDHFGVTSRFYKKDGRFMVATPGARRRNGRFRNHPHLRLVSPAAVPDSLSRRAHAVPAHRLGFAGEALVPPLPGPPLAADDWLYWTNNGQNWNAMCAECHSTDLRKNYDPDDDTYHTAWSEISVGCEACHGPGSDHVAWAQLPEMGRPDVPIRPSR
jgi:hypothetical protein